MSKGTVNKAIIIGRLGKDPDTRYTPSGLSVANFNVATNHGVKDANGTFQDKTEWHRIVAYGKLADFAGSYLQKGRLVFIEGRIQSRSWEDKEGQKRFTTEIICSALQLLGSKGESEAKAETEAPESEEATPDTPPAPAREGGEEDDLPF